MRSPILSTGAQPQSNVGSPFTENLVWTAFSRGDMDRGVPQPWTNRSRDFWWKDWSRASGILLYRRRMRCRRNSNVNSSTRRFGIGSKKKPVSFGGHQKKDKAKAEAFKRNFLGILNGLALDKGKPVKIWFADESRYGLLPVIRRV